MRMDLSAFLSLLRGDDLNRYAIWRGVAGTDVADQRRFANTVRTGIVYSFSGSRIIPDAIEEINLPERGVYAWVQPSWIVLTSGQLRDVEAQGLPPSGRNLMVPVHLCGRGRSSVHSDCQSRGSDHVEKLF